MPSVVSGVRFEAVPVVAIVGHKLWSTDLQYKWITKTGIFDIFSVDLINGMTVRLQSNDSQQRSDFNWRRSAQLSATDPALHIQQSQQWSEDWCLNDRRTTSFLWTVVASDHSPEQRQQRVGPSGEGQLDQSCQRTRHSLSQFGRQFIAVSVSDLSVDPTEWADSDRKVQITTASLQSILLQFGNNVSMVPLSWLKFHW